MEVNYKDGSDQITTFSQDSQASNKSNEKCSSPSYHKEEMLIKTESSEYEESQQDAPQSNEVLNDEEKHYDSLGLLDIKKELDYNGDPLENTSKLFCEKIIELIKPEPDDLELLETNRDTYFINSNEISVLGKRKRSGSTENYHSETEQDQEVMSVDKDISHTTENIMEVETLHSNDDDNVASCSFQADDSAQNTSNECLYECNVCSKKFLTGLALKLHQHKQHNGSSDKFVEISNSEVFCDFKRKVDWDRDTSLQLLSEFQNNEILWNVKHKSYFNNSKKERAWRELSKIFDTNVIDVKKKLDSLRSSYRRVRNREQRKLQTGQSDALVSTWFAFESMKFLDERIDSRKAMFSAEQDGSEAIENRVNVSKNNRHVELNSKNNASNNGLTSRKPEKRKLLMLPRTSVVKTRKDEYADYGKAHRNLRNDECGAYGDYIANKLRKLDNRTRATVQHRINKIVFEAEMKDFGIKVPAQQENVGVSTST